MTHLAIPWSFEATLTCVTLGNILTIWVCYVYIEGCMRNPSIYYVLYKKAFVKDNFFCSSIVYMYIKVPGREYTFCIRNRLYIIIWVYNLENRLIKALLINKIGTLLEEKFSRHMAPRNRTLMLPHTFQTNELIQTVYLENKKYPL